MPDVNRIHVMVFPGAHNLPLWVIQHVCPDLLEIRYTKSRDEQFVAFQNRSVHIIHTAPDNLWMADAEGCAPFMGGTVGQLTLVANDKWEQSERLAVDNPNSGFALLAYRWIDQYMDVGKYEAIPMGGTDGRFAALKNDLADAAVMSAPFTQMCVDLGFRVLGRVDEGVATMAGVCRAHEIEEFWVQEYKALYRLALELLRGDSGLSLATKLVQRHMDMGESMAAAIAGSMQEPMIQAGVELREEEFNKAREIRGWFTSNSSVRTTL